MYLGSPRVFISNQTAIRLAVFAQRTPVRPCDWQTYRLTELQTPETSITIVRIFCVRCGLIKRNLAARFWSISRKADLPQYQLVYLLTNCARMATAVNVSSFFLLISIFVHRSPLFHTNFSSHLTHPIFRVVQRCATVSATAELLLVRTKQFVARQILSNISGSAGTCV